LRDTRPLLSVASSQSVTGPTNQGCAAFRRTDDRQAGTPSRCCDATL
jgi:hypothetical protein